MASCPATFQNICHLDWIFHFKTTCNPFITFFYRTLCVCLWFYYSKLRVIGFSWIFEGPFRRHHREIFSPLPIWRTDIEGCKRQKLVTVNPLFFVQRKSRKNFFHSSIGKLKTFLTLRHSSRVLFLSTCQLQKLEILSHLWSWRVF